MPRNPLAALRVALIPMTMAALLAVTLLAPLAKAPAAQARTRGADTCANKRCTRDKPWADSCRERDGYKAVARCFITRAARHYGQSPSLAKAIAYRESRYHWWVTNSSGHRGLYQFDDTLWAHTPYHARSPYNPRYASLAAMWEWKHGGMHHWAL